MTIPSDDDDVETHDRASFIELKTDPSGGYDYWLYFANCPKNPEGMTGLYFRDKFCRTTPLLLPQIKTIDYVLFRR